MTYDYLLTVSSLRFVTALDLWRSFASSFARVTPRGVGWGDADSYEVVSLGGLLALIIGMGDECSPSKRAVCISA